MMNTLAAIIPPRNRPTRGTATAEPGDVIALTTNADAFRTAGSPVSPGLEAEQTQYWVYGQTTSGNTDWDQATIVSSAPAGTVGGQSIEAVSIQLPYSLPVHSLYLLYEVNQMTGQAATYSQPYVINQPQVWWTDQNNSYVGGKVSVFGTNLSYGDSLQPYSDQSWVYLFPSNSAGVFNESSAPIVLPLTAVAPDAINGSGAMDVNPYKVDFSLPAGVVANGYYQVEIYNGHGGVYGLSRAADSSGSGSLIYVAPAQHLEVPPLVPLAQAYCYWTGEDATVQNNLDQVWVNDDPSSGMLKPSAINDAIDFASSIASGTNYGGPYSYIGIQLPPGLVEITDSTDIYLKPYAHLVGAGDTGNFSTGTVIAGGASDLTALISLYSYAGATCYGAAISDMMLESNGDVAASDGVVFDDGGNVNGFTLQRVTIDATNDIPSDPEVSEDVNFSVGGNSHLQFLDSTFIGMGMNTTTNYSIFDNCHFIGCGATIAQISTDTKIPNADLSITRCTDQSWINNITSPGGDVEYDGAGRLIWDQNTGGNLYIADNVTRDMYISLVDNGNGPGGAEIELEDGGDQPPNHNITVYQNTLSGDGAEDFNDGDGGIEFAASNAIVADNDISNLCNAIFTWNSGDRGIQQSFGMYVDNSIHNVTCGINATFAAAQVSNGTLPAGLGNSFSDNLINGIIGGGPAISVEPYVPDNQPPTLMMNIFYGDVVGGAAIGFGFLLDNQPPNGPTVILDCEFISDGSSGSQGYYSAFPSYDPVASGENFFQGFWAPNSSS